MSQASHLFPQCLWGGLLAEESHSVPQMRSTDEEHCDLTFQLLPLTWDLPFHSFRNSLLFWSSSEEDGLPQQSIRRKAGNCSLWYIRIWNPSKNWSLPCSGIVCLSQSHHGSWWEALQERAFQSLPIWVELLKTKAASRKPWQAKIEQFAHTKKQPPGSWQCNLRAQL